MVTLFTSAGMVEVLDVWFKAPKGEQRWNAPGVCRKCGQKTSACGWRASVRTARGWTEALVLSDGRLFAVENGLAYFPCRSGCGRVRVATQLQGKVNPRKACNAKCMGACGPACECSCGGKNHGAAFSL